jgi:EAL domain-containing protein (putative c-di-GMP-specific phosphodiesterase class I)/CheY-like chemotaxis protein
MQTILVVDDDESVRSLISVILQIEGFTVLTAASAETALELVADHDVDVVTIDIAMPGLGGAALSRRLREDPRTASIRQMVISGDTERLHQSTTPLPVDAVLVKPFDFTRFVEALQKIMAAHTEPAQPATEGDIAEVLANELVLPVFQPIVDLRDGSVVGVEGLARGPVGPLLMPSALFSRAHQAGCLHELDILCRTKIIEVARDSGVAPPLVFVNVEPGTVHLPMSDRLTALLAGSLPFRIVVEFTERALAQRVAALLRHAEEIRHRGNVVALDDLGVEPSSVALLPVVQPEIIKLDLSLLAPDVSPERTAAAIAAVAYAQRTGAVILAEGIETEQQRATAIALGAQWGQGYLFAKPGPLDELMGHRVRRDTPPLPRRERVDADAGTTPFGLVRAAGHRLWEGSWQDLHDIRVRLERQALSLGRSGVILVSVASPEEIEERLPAYEEAAASVSVMGIFGPGLSPEPVGRAYGVALDPDEPLAREWVQCILGPHFTAVMVGRLRDEQPTGEPVYEYAVVHDAALAERIGRSLTRRITPRPAISRTTALQAG